MSTIVRNEIKELVEIIHEQTNTILSYPEIIPQIEIDIVRENLRKLYDLMRQIERINNTSVRQPNIVVDIEKVVHSEVKEEVKAEERVESYLDFVATTFTNEPPVYQEEIIENSTESESIANVIEKEVPIFSFLEVKEEVEESLTTVETETKTVLLDETLEEKSEPVLPTEIISENLEEPLFIKAEEVKVEEKMDEEPLLFGDLVEKPTIEPKPEPVLNEVKKEELKIETPKFEKSDSIKTEVISHSEKKSFNGFIGKPIDSLKKAIGINDKFQFINELFEGNMGRYNKTIDSLDAAGNFDSANKIVAEIAVELEWDTEDKAYTQLQNYLIRRYN